MVIFEPVFLQSDEGNTNVSLRSVLFWCKKGRGQHDGNVKPLSGGFKLSLRWFSRFCKKYFINIVYVVGDQTSTLWYRLDDLSKDTVLFYFANESMKLEFHQNIASPSNVLGNIEFNQNINIVLHRDSNLIQFSMSMLYRQFKVEFNYC